MSTCHTVWKSHVAAHMKEMYINDVASVSEITPCNKIDKPLVVYRFSGNVMTAITTFHKFKVILMS